MESRTIQLKLNEGGNVSDFGPFEAIEFTGTSENYDEIIKFSGYPHGHHMGIISSTGFYKNDQESGISALWVSYRSGIVKMEVKDWLVKCVKHNILFPMSGFTYRALFGQSS